MAQHAPTDGFDRFWAVYPRKVGKLAALKQWRQLHPNPALVKEILVSVAQQQASRQWKQGYIPNPATWLHQGRWMDEPTVEPERPFTASELAEAKRMRNGWGRCEHEPVCETYKQCLARLIRAWRAYDAD